MMLNAVEADV